MKNRKLKNTIFLLILCTVFTLSSPLEADAGDYEETVDSFTIDGVTVPGYDGYPSEVVNGNDPLFDESDFGEEPLAYYGDLDVLGRCTEADALLNQSLMPTWTRGSISSVYPSGWVQAQYSGIVPGTYLYNRCHLIGWQLTGADLTSMSKEELAKDLITGTRYLNVGSGSDGMVEYENEVANYIKESPEHNVAYSVLPIFFDDDLVARGVLMQGKSIGSDEVSFCIFCYNVQPGIAIDYETGKSRLSQSEPDNISIKECSISIPSRALVYTGEGLTKAVTVTYEDALLTENVDYTVTYKNNVYPGKASVIVAGAGTFKDAVQLDFIITPAKSAVTKLTAKKKSIKITVREQPGVTGYQFAYKRSKAKKWTIKTGKTRTKTIKKLKKKKKYNVKVRSYKTIEGKKYYGAWSTVKTVKLKKR